MQVLRGSQSLYEVLSENFVQHQVESPLPQQTQEFHSGGENFAEFR